MRNINLRYIWKRVVLFSVLAGMLLCMNGCKFLLNGPGAATSIPTGTTTMPDNTNPDETTQPTGTTQPTETTKPTEDTTPPENTLPDCVHELDNWIVEIASTCTTAGNRYRACRLCKYKVEQETIPIIPHSPSPWIVDRQATCIEEGLQHQECIQCKITLLSITVSKADHNTYPIKGYNATYSTPGLTKGYLCVACGMPVQDQFIIPPTHQLGVLYEINSDMATCTISGFSKRNETALILPDTIDGYTVTGIKTNAFYGNTSLTTVYLPDTIVYVGARAFRNCTSLTNITYEGTTLDWLAVTKGSDWNTNTGNYEVYCSNNSLPKQ